MVSDSLTPPLFTVLDLPFRGSSPNKGQTPVEWGEIHHARPSVCLSNSICLSIHLPRLTGPDAWLARAKAWLASPEAWLASSEAWLAGQGLAGLALGPGWLGLGGDVRTNDFPLSGQLP